MPPALHRRLVLLAGAALLSVPAALAAAVPAHAHDEVVATTPEDGTALTAVPESVSLTFSDEVQSMGAAVVVTDSTGARVADGAPVVDGVTVTQALLPDVAAGPVKVAYRIVSSDGHPVTGSWTFTLDLPAQTSAAPSQPSPSQPSPEPSSVPPTSAGPSATATEPAASSGLPLGAVAGGAVLVVAAGAAVALGLRRGGGSGA